MLVQIAREIAIDHWPLEEILSRFKVTEEQWEELAANPRFKLILEQEIVAWNTAVNTHERIKLKSGAILEDWLLEATARLHDKNEPLSAKASLAQTIGKFAGVGVSKEAAEGSGERFTVHINLGGGEQIKLEKQVAPQKLIEGDAV
jgi:hypothetical protein